MKYNRNAIFILITWAVLVATFLTFSITFIQAYINGGMRIIVINNYGEATLELFIIIIGSIMILFSTRGIFRKVGA